jgi:hypothetical protein
VAAWRKRSGGEAPLYRSQTGLGQMGHIELEESPTAISNSYPTYFVQISSILLCYIIYLQTLITIGLAQKI